jgi:hypothetical protein
VKENGWPEHVSRAQSCFADVLAAGLQPTLSANIVDGNDWRKGEYDVVVENGRHFGVLHEHIAAALTIAERFGARLFLPTMGEGAGKLVILFAYEDPLGPDKPEEQSPVERTRRAARGTQAKAPPKKRPTRKRKS